MARPHGHPLDETDDDRGGPLRHSLADIDVRARLKLERKGLGTWTPIKIGREPRVTVLLIREEPGILLMRPWENYGTSVVNRLRELKQRDDDEDVREEIKYIYERYERGEIIGNETRITLSPYNLLHLFLRPSCDTQQHVLLYFHKTGVDINHKSVRDERQRNNHRAYPHLP